jgi:hypothetical protein
MAGYSALVATHIRMAAQTLAYVVGKGGDGVDARVRDAMRFGDLNINDQIEFGRQLEGQVGDLRALQNFFHIVRGSTIRFRSVMGPRKRHPASKPGERFAQVARALQEKSCPGAWRL